MLSLIITLAVVGLLVYLIETYVPMAAPFKTVIRIIVVVCLILWLIQVFGLMSYDVPVPSLHRR
jgi:hypothetical protein